MGDTMDSCGKNVLLAGSRNCVPDVGGRSQRQFNAGSR
jgi:hypothetical protein